VAHVQLASVTERGKKYKPPAVCSRAVSGPSDARAFDVRTALLPLFSLLARDAETYGYAVDISDGRIVVGAPETDKGCGTFESVGTIIDAATLSGLSRAADEFRFLPRNGCWSARLAKGS